MNLGFLKCSYSFPLTVSNFFIPYKEQYISHLYIYNISLTSVMAGFCGYVGSSSSGEPPIKNLLISGVGPFPIGLQVSASRV